MKKNDRTSTHRGFTYQNCKLRYFTAVLTFFFCSKKRIKAEVLCCEGEGIQLRAQYSTATFRLMRKVVLGSICSADVATAI